MLIRLLILLPLLMILPGCYHAQYYAMSGEGGALAYASPPMVAQVPLYARPSYESVVVQPVVRRFAAPAVVVVEKPIVVQERAVAMRSHPHGYHPQRHHHPLVKPSSFDRGLQQHTAQRVSQHNKDARRKCENHRCNQQ